jgi:hypothetical protein
MQSHGQVHEARSEKIMNRGNMGKQIAMPGRRMANMPQMGGGMAAMPATMQRRAMPMPMKKGGAVKKMAKGGMTRGDGCCMKGKTKGKMY